MGIFLSFRDLYSNGENKIINRIQSLAMCTGKHNNSSLWKWEINWRGQRHVGKQEKGWKWR